MHAFHGKNGTKFFFNGDYSEILILKPGEEEEIKIDPEDFMNFAKRVVGSQVIELIENNFC